MEHYREAELFLFLDGEIDSASWQAIQKHLLQCESCTLTVENWRRLRANLLKDEQILNPPHFVEQVMRRIRIEGDIYPVASRLWSWFFPLLEVSLIIVILVSLPQKQRMMDPELVLFSNAPNQGLESVLMIRNPNLPTLLGMDWEE